MSLTISEAPVSLVLKEATIEFHQQAEAVLYPRLEGIASLNDYTSILKMFYGFFHPLEAEISEHITEKVLHDISERRKSDLIIDDLQALGMKQKI
jgi:heme oxygenase